MSKVLVDRELLERAAKGEQPWPRLKDHLCVGCGAWMPKYHPEAHRHEDGCEEEALTEARHWRKQLRAILAQPAEADGVPTWRERILAIHPKSDPKFWPDALLVDHMQPEIDELRAALSAVTAERDALRAENKRLDLMVAQADYNYDMDRNRMTGLLKNALICLEQWNLMHPRLAKRGDEGSSEYTYRQIREFLPEYREFDAAMAAKEGV